MSNDVQEKLSRLYIGTIANREGQYLRLKLMESLPLREDLKPLYLLKIQIENSEESLGFDIEGFATRPRLTTKAFYELQDYETLTTLTRGHVTTYGSFNYIEDAFYSNTMAEFATRESNLDRIADILILDIALFLENLTSDSKKLEKASPSQGIFQKACRAGAPCP
jgi:hypothetical protein